MTNFEKIKNTNPKELEYTRSIVITDRRWCPIYEFCKMHKNDISAWKQWLESEAEQ